MRFTQNAQYNGRPVIVALGFDLPLNGFFMTVEPADENNPDASEETGMIYSNLDDTALPSPRLTPNIEYFKQRLREMKILVPPYFFDRVEAECD